MRDAGFATVGFTDGGYVSGHFGFAEGFAQYNHQTRAPEEVLSRDRLPRDGRPDKNKGLHIFDRAISALESFDFASQPLFLFLHTYSVHDYFKQNRWALDALNLEPVRNASYFVGCLQGVRRCSDNDWARLSSLYFAEVDNLDRAFGQLLDAVDSAVSSSESIFIVLSDHGEGFDPAHGRIHHGGRLHSDQIHVPLMVRSEPTAPKTVSSVSVSLVDIAPTIMEMVDSTAPTGLDGRSFAKHLEPKSHPSTPPQRGLFAMEHFHWWENGKRRDVDVIPKAPLATANIFGDRLYIAHAPGAEEMYRMSSDPRQLHNLTELLDESQDLSRARARMDALKIVKRVDASPAPLSEEVEEELESLGYIQR